MEEVLAVTAVAPALKAKDDPVIAEVTENAEKFLDAVVKVCLTAHSSCAKMLNSTAIACLLYSDSSQPEVEILQFTACLDISLRKNPAAIDTSCGQMQQNSHHPFLFVTYPNLKGLLL